MRLSDAIARESARSTAQGVSGIMERLSKMQPGQAASALGVALLLYSEVGKVSVHEVLDSASRQLRDTGNIFKLASRIDACRDLLRKELRS